MSEQQTISILGFEEAPLTSGLTGISSNTEPVRPMRQTQPLLLTIRQRTLPYYREHQCYSLVFKTYP